MGETVQALIRGVGLAGIRPGDAWVHNDPFDGGTHLPDITVVTPAFGPDPTAGPRFWLASRGHHADLGGISPGSMPPDSQTIADEGIRFNAFLLLRDGAFRETELRAALADGPWPARDPDQNVADLQAQVAANLTGLAALAELADRRGSGGAGRWRGGDGAIRRLRFLAPMTCAILSSRRETAPFGLAGGGPGQPGLNRVERADGRVEPLPARA
jgi:5-oxoprolinase (ATP-hydrolysing)